MNDTDYMYWDLVHKLLWHLGGWHHPARDVSSAVLRNHTTDVGDLVRSLENTRMTAEETLAFKTVKECLAAGSGHKAAIIAAEALHSAGKATYRALFLEALLAIGRSTAEGYLRRSCPSAVAEETLSISNGHGA